MGTESVVKSGKVVINSQMYREISNFLATPKREALVRALDEAGELMQGQLAKEIDSSATSLANITARFEQFKYKLLDAKSVGKCRYYSLSELGIAYIRQMKEKNSAESNAGILEWEDGDLLRRAREALHGFELKQGESWQTQMDDALVRRTRGVGSLLDELSEQLVNQYLESLKRLILRESHEMLGQALGLLQNQILRDRVEAYMNCFEPFLPILSRLQKQDGIFGLLKGVEMIFTGKNDRDGEKFLKAAGLEDRECTRLKEIAAELRQRVGQYDEEELYRYFNSLLPDCELLSYSIARWMGDRDKMNRVSER